jgi:hypothetical protein
MQYLRINVYFCQKNNNMLKITLKTLAALLLINVWACQHKAKETNRASTTAIKYDKAYSLEKLLQLKDIAHIMSKYGPQNVLLDSTYTMPDSTLKQITVLFPHSNKELLLFLEEKNKIKQIIAVETSNNTWHSSTGVHIGMPMSQLVQLNQKAFSISGFDWAFGGYLVGWEGGALQNSGLGLQFAKDNYPQNTKLWQAISGQTEYYTNHESLQKLDPVVQKLWLAVK